MNFVWLQQRPDGRNCSYLICQKTTQADEVGAMAVQAINFISAYDRCLEDRRIVGFTSKVLPLQAAMCGAFAIEVGIKAVMVANKIEVPRDRNGKKTHDLDLLYKALPEELRLEIESAFTFADGAFHQMLSAISRLFERARYSYEVEELTIDLQFLRNFILVLEPYFWNLAKLTPGAPFATREAINADTRAEIF